MSQSKYLILAHQRCGTNYLGSILRSNSDIFQYGEVLYPSFEVLGFFSFFLQEINKDKNKLLLTNYEIVDQLFKEYFESVCIAVPEPIVGFDIKIDQMSCFPRLFSASQIFDFLRFKVVHLCRRNYLDTIISHILMNKRIFQGDLDIHKCYVPPKQTLRINCYEVVEWIKANQSSDRFVEEVFGSSPNYRKIFYEDISSKDDTERRGAIAEILDFLSVHDPLDFEESYLVKQNPWNKKEIIENYDDLAEFLSEHGFSCFLES